MESFDPFILRWFKLHAPHILRGQLSMPMDEFDKKYNPLLRFAMSKCFMNCHGRPHFISYMISGNPIATRITKRMGALQAIWTSRTKGEGPDKDMVIFEFYRPEL